MEAVLIINTNICDCYKAVSNIFSAIALSVTSLINQHYLCYYMYVGQRSLNYCAEGRGYQDT